jgi:pyrimidine 5'-nucleotidase
MDVLLLDFDHTLYPSTLPTLDHIDSRITEFIETRLGVAFGEADALRKSLCAEYGTTLRGLMLGHGIDPHGYCEFIHAIDDAVLPPPDALLRQWLQQLPMPTYIFTNARADWAERGLKNMGLWDMVAEKNGSGENENRAGGNGKPLFGFSKTPLLGILDIEFTGWIGKPDPLAYLAVETFITQSHGSDIRLHLVDDRLDNLATAAERGWRTHWVQPHHYGEADLARRAPHVETVVLRSLTDLHPTLLCRQ